LPEKSEADNGSSGAFWSGTITFGLVSVPVELYPANRPSHLSLRTLAPDGTPLRRQYVSAESGRELSPKALARGYDAGKAGFILVTDEELEKLAPEKSHDIDLRVFVGVDQIDPIYSERGYFLAPTGDSAKAYGLLATVLGSMRKAGIATFVMRGKEYLISIVAEGGVLRAETLRFQDEIRTPEDIGLPEKSNASKALVHQFEKIIDHHAANALPQDELHDKTSQSLLRILKSKQARKHGLIVRPTSEQEAAAPDLLAALKKSLAVTHGRSRKSSTTNRPGHFRRVSSRRHAGARRTT
jgi:DNA end-binding protein Ku